MSAVELSRGDSRTWVDALYRTYRQDVYRSLLRDLGSPSDADDCTQTVFLNAMRALDRGSRPYAAKAWLLTIARNVARRQWRERSAASELEPDELAARETPDQACRELFEVLEDLPESQRTALLLHELCGLGYTEISAVTDQSVAGIETAVCRARKTVRAALRHDGALDHEHAAKLLRRLVDGKLTRHERQAVMAHIASCCDCASAETAMRRTRSRRGLGVLTWVTSLPSLAQRLAAALQANPIRGAGAVAVCAVGLAAVSGDGSAGAPETSSNVTPAAASVHDAASVVRPQAIGALTAAASTREPRTVGVTAHPLRTTGPPGPAQARPTSTSSAPTAPAAAPRGAPAQAPADARQSPQGAADEGAPPPHPAAAATVEQPPQPQPVRAQPAAPARDAALPVDIGGRVDDVTTIVEGVAAGDVSAAGAGVDSTLGGTAQGVGVPAPPPLAEPAGAVVDDAASAAVGAVDRLPLLPKGR